MGFTLKKILSAFLMPLPIGLLLLLLGLIYLYVSSYKKAKFYLSIGFLWIFIVSYSPFANNFLSPLEDKFSKIENIERVNYILLLGGDFKGRSFEAIKLYYQMNNVKIITSGYPGSYKTVSEAEISAEKLKQMGIPTEDIIMQIEPKDTQEEAVYVKKIVGNEPFILVTAAYHMPRAMGIFKKNGLNPIAAPTNYLAKKKTSLLSLPSSRNIQRTEIAWHEYLGMTWYWLKSFLN